MGQAVGALTHYFVGDATMGETLTHVAGLVVEAVPAAKFVGITMIVDDRIGTFVFTHPTVPEIDRAQYDTGDGPCVTAFRTGQPVVIASTEEDRRFPTFNRVAAEHGIGSVMSLPMRADTSTLGAMNLYAERQEAFGEEEMLAATGFCAQAAFLLANAQAYWDARTLSEGLREAMKSRSTIEHATGIIMGAMGIDAEAAFDELRRQSQHQNIKLRDVAAQLVRQTARRASDPARRSHPPDGSG